MLFVGYMKNSGMNISTMPDGMESVRALTEATKASGCSVTHTGMLEGGAGVLGLTAFAFIGYKLFKYMS